MTTAGIPEVLLILCLALPAGAQQRADPNYNPVVENPVYPQGAGPRIGFDETHGSYHSVRFGGTFTAFAEALEKDGYVVDPFAQEFSEASFAAFDILAIVNAEVGFTQQEIAAVRDWVAGGGSLLLVADVMPWPGFANPLSREFGVEFNDGFAMFPNQRTIFSFHREPQRGSGGTLADHPVTNGRNPGERVERVGVFTGSAFEVAGQHEPLMTFGPGMISLMPLEPFDFRPDTPSIPIEGWLQGAVLEFGEGRLAVFGEAAMFSAQIASNGRDLMGMNASRTNLQFLLNLMHWLSGLLPVPAGQPPVLTSQGVVHAATLSNPGVVAPGLFVSLFGSELASETAVAEALPLPAELAGTSATIGGRPLALLLASPGQLNGVVPFGVPVGEPQPLVVTSGTTGLEAGEVAVVAAQPGVFTTSQSGEGQGVILHAPAAGGEARLADARNPARPGDALVIYCAGLGEVSPAVEAGAAAPAVEPLARTVAAVEVTVGGLPAEVLFAGLAPGFAGLYQVNVLAPEGVAVEDAASVVLTVNGVSSPPVAVAVGPAD